MAFKINVSHSGKTFKVETSVEELVGMNIGDSLQGEVISVDLVGYELLITGTSDKSGFAGLSNVDGPNQKKLLLGYGRGMKKKPKGERKKTDLRKPKGLRLRKTVRGREISEFTVQINTKVVKVGKKSFEDLFKAPEAEENKKE